MIGLLFAVFSLCQLFAAPVLGDWSDRFGRRPVLIFSLAGTVVSFVMLAHFTGAPPDSTYIPAHIENGKFVPGVEKPGTPGAPK